MEGVATSVSELYIVLPTLILLEVYCTVCGVGAQLRRDGGKGGMHGYLIRGGTCHGTAETVSYTRFRFRNMSYPDRMRFQIHVGSGLYQYLGVWLLLSSLCTQRCSISQRRPQPLEHEEHNMHQDMCVL